MEADDTMVANLKEMAEKLGIPPGVITKEHTNKFIAENPAKIATAARRGQLVPDCINKIIDELNASDSDKTSLHFLLVATKHFLDSVHQILEQMEEQSPSPSYIEGMINSSVVTKSTVLELRGTFRKYEQFFNRNGVL